MANKPSTPRPALPKILLFEGKGILGRAVGVSFGTASTGTLQVAINLVTSAKQRAKLYAVPEGFAGKPGEMAEIPEGVEVTCIKSLTPDAMEYAIDALRRAGWTGAKLKELQAAAKAGDLQGLGSVEAKMSISIDELNKDGGWNVDEKGNFRPRMKVDWINSAGGFAFKEEAAASALDALDREFGAEIGAGAPKGAKAAPKPAGGAPAKTGTSETPAAAPPKVYSPDELKAFEAEKLAIEAVAEASRTPEQAARLKEVEAILEDIPF